MESINRTLLLRYRTVRHTGVLNGTSSRTDLYVQGRQTLELSTSWKETEQEFLRTGRAADVQAALARIFQRAALDAFRGSFSSSGTAMLIAAGDFARAEMLPYSTADMVIVDEKASDASGSVDEFLRRLWASGVRPALRTQTVVEYLAVPERNADLAIKLLDRKVLAGVSGGGSRFDEQFDSALSRRREHLLERLISQARSRHAKYRNTPAHGQPDVEEGPGGLRDFRLARSIRRLSDIAIPDLEGLDKSAQFLFSVQCFLEYRARDERTLFDVAAQEAMAEQFHGRSAAVWMRSYFRHAWAVFGAARHAMNACDRTPSQDAEPSTPEFEVAGRQVRLRDPEAIHRDPENGVRLIEFVARTGIPPDPQTEHSLHAARDAITALYGAARPLWPALKAIFELPHAPLALRVLQSTDLLSAILPEWLDIEGTPAGDPDQLFTIDEQALMAVERVSELRASSDPKLARFSQVLSEIENNALSLLGELLAWLPSQAAEAAVARMQPSQAERDEVLSAIEQRSLLAGLVTRDLNDPATVRRAAERIGTIERLKLLLILTYGQVAAEFAEPNLSFRLDQAWRAYKATSLELTRGLETDRIRDVPTAFPENADFIKGFPTRYLRAHAADEIAAHIRLYEASRSNGVAVQLDPLDGGYQLTVVANDRPGLFGSFAGAIASFGLNILKAEAFSNSEGVILDTFVVTDPKRALELNPSEAERLQDLVARIGLGKTEARRLFRGGAQTQSRAPTIEPRIHFDSNACESATLVEIVAEDRPGLLYALASVFSAAACNIDTVLIDTKGHRALDVFYVARDGTKLAPEFQEELKRKLVAACLGGEAAAQVICR